MGYDQIKTGVKFTPNKRGPEYSVYTVFDVCPETRSCVCGCVVYVWCGGYYSRLNRRPITCDMGFDELLSTHSPACQGKRKPR